MINTVMEKRKKQEPPSMHSATKEIAVHIGKEKLQLHFDLYEKMVEIKKQKCVIPYPKELKSIVKNIGSLYSNGYLSQEEAQRLLSIVQRAVMMGIGGRDLSKSFRDKLNNLMHYTAENIITNSGEPNFPINILIISLVGELKAPPGKLTYDLIFDLITDCLREMNIAHLGHIKTQYERWSKPDRRANLREFFNYCIIADRTLFSPAVISIRDRHFPKK